MLEIIKNNNFTINGDIYTIKKITICNFFSFIRNEGGKIYNTRQLLKNKYLASEINYILYNSSINSNKCELIKSLNKHVKYININCFITEIFKDIYGKTFYKDLIKLLDKMKTLYKLKYGGMLYCKICMDKIFYIKISNSRIDLPKNITLQKIMENFNI